MSLVTTSFVENLTIFVTPSLSLGNEVYPYIRPGNSIIISLPAVGDKFTRRSTSIVDRFSFVKPYTYLSYIYFSCLWTYHPLLPIKLSSIIDPSFCSPSFDVFEPLASVRYRLQARSPGKQLTMAPKKISKSDSKVLGISSLSENLATKTSFCGTTCKTTNATLALAIVTVITTISNNSEAVPEVTWIVFAMR